MQKVAVVIPIYRKILNKIEQASLNQCLRILGHYPIKFICPNSLDVGNYKVIADSMQCEYSFEKFEDKYFIDINGYSKMLLNKSFWEHFNDFEFTLIYQLDAWVFEDKLDYWCNQNYDYIGAPWFEGYILADQNSPILPVAGNGGFSLRKVSTMLKILKTNLKAPMSLREIYKYSSKKGQIAKFFNVPFYIFRYAFQMAHYFPIWEITQRSEDFVFIKYGGKAYKDFRLAPPEVAMKFSFETQPRRLYEMNDNNLPFGCHSFEHYDFEFWQQFISV